MIKYSAPNITVSRFIRPDMVLVEENVLLHLELDYPEILYVGSLGAKNWILPPAFLYRVSQKMLLIFRLK